MKKKIFTIIAISSFCLNMQAQGQMPQIGSDVTGISNQDNFGQSVDLSDDGTRMVVGAPKANLAGNSSGAVQVFDVQSNSFVQLGANLQGTSNGERFGESVAISDDGTTIAVGSPAGSITFSNNLPYDQVAAIGQVNIYRFTSGNWNQIGATLVGDQADDLFGFSVVLNSNGNSVLIGAPNSGSNGQGKAVAYEYDGTNWAQIGSDLLGTNTESGQFGFSVSMDESGSTIAVNSLPRPNSSNEYDDGYVQVHSKVSNSWNQMGGNIIGFHTHDDFGRGLDLSADGSHLAIGTPKYSLNGLYNGLVQVYTFSSTFWLEYGDNIEGTFNSALGWSVAISNDGQRIISGAIEAAGAGNTFSGFGRVSVNNGGLWEDECEGVYGSSYFAQLGGSSSISGNGKTMAFGARQAFDSFDPSTNIPGHVRVFSSCNQQLGLNDDLLNSAVELIYNYENQYLYLNGYEGEIEDLKVFDITGKALQSSFEVVSNNSVQMSIKDLSRGTYFINHPEFSNKFLKL